MIRTAKTIMMFALLFLSGAIKAQPKAPKQGKAEATYHLPSNLNGPELVFVTINYRLTSYAGDLVVGMSSATKISNNYRYRGKSSMDWNALPGFSKIRAKDPKVRFRVVGPNVNREMSFQLLDGGNSGLLGANSTTVAKIGKANPGDFEFTLLSIEGISIVNSGELHAAIDKFLTNFQQTQAIRTLITEAQDHIAKKDFRLAENKIGKAKSLLASVKDEKLRRELTQLEGDFQKEKAASEQKTGSQQVPATKLQHAQADATNEDPDKQSWSSTPAASSQQTEDKTASEQYQERIDDYWKQQKKKEVFAEQQAEAIKTSVQNTFTSYYAAQAASNASKTMANSARLEGDYQTLEQLDNAFQKRLNEIQKSERDLRQASSQQVSATYNALYRNSSAQEQAVGTALAGIASIANDISAEKKRRQAEERLEAQYQARLREMNNRRMQLEKERKEHIISMRKQILEEFPEGNVPLSFHNIEAKEVYFFLYAFDKSTVDKDATLIKLSNVFPVYRYKDGSWIFANQLKSQIATPEPGEELTLVGFYTNEEEAKKQRTAFSSYLQKTNIQISEFEVIKIGNSGQNMADNQAVDFWGNQKEVATEENRSTDFWGNKKSESQDLPSEE